METQTPPQEKPTKQKGKTKLSHKVFLIIMGGMLEYGLGKNAYIILKTERCVSGNPDYEASNGLCSGYWGKKDSEERIAKQKLEAEMGEKLRKKQEDDEWYNQLSRYTCERTLKENLRNPSSYQRDGSFATVADNGEDKTIMWKFRAENGFGGLNVATASCDITRKNGGGITVSSR